MSELKEFAEALLDQISVETNEEKVISDLSNQINDDTGFTMKFEGVETISEELFPKMAEKVNEFTGIPVSTDLKIEYLDLEDFKRLKGKKVFATNDSIEFVNQLFNSVAKNDTNGIIKSIEKDTAKFLVYSTYVKSYLSKISTTYGDFLDSTIFLNKFILANYPQIILYKQGSPYEKNFESVRSGYVGALKMTMLEEQIHSTQTNLQEKNKTAAINVNSINEELAKIILNIDDKTATILSDYLQLPVVPDEFPIAKRANLFFYLNPDNFIVNVLGPDVMTYTHVEIDPKISDLVPNITDIYQRWLLPIQTHQSVFSTMEGMAEFAIKNILKDDVDFQNYLTTFMGTDFSSYAVQKNMGKDFTEKVFEKFGKNSFKILLESPPSTKELKDPEIYLKRDLSTGSSFLK